MFSMYQDRRIKVARAGLLGRRVEMCISFQGMKVRSPLRQVTHSHPIFVYPGDIFQEVIGRPGD